MTYDPDAKTAPLTLTRCGKCAPSCRGAGEDHNDAGPCQYEGGCGCRAYDEVDVDLAPLPPANAERESAGGTLRRAGGGRMARPTYDEIRQDAWARYDLQVTRAELMGRGPLAYGLEPNAKAPAMEVNVAADRLESLLNYIQEPPFCDPDEKEE